MSDITEKTAIALLKALASLTPTTPFAPGSLPSPARARAAVKRCCAAWHRVYNACKNDAENANSYFNKFEALEAASQAYSNAMPLLVDHQGICAFMACLSHGILIGAVPADKSGRLTYNAQVALSTIQRVSKPSRSAPKKSPRRASKAGQK